MSDVVGSSVPIGRRLWRMMDAVTCVWGRGRRSARALLFSTLPDFLIIGAAKSGTTSLYGLISAHPHVLPARIKEIEYFAPTGIYLSGPTWYRDHFPTVLHMYGSALLHGHRMLTGEATAVYMFHPDVPGRVRDLLPNVRLIAILRNPVDRAYSEYNMRLGRGNESLTFEDAIAAERNRASYGETSDSRSQYNLYHSYLGRGRYAEQLIRWYKCFDRNRLLILTTEELEDDRQGMLDRVFGFLGLKPFEVGGSDGLPDSPWMKKYKSEPPHADDPFKLNVGRYPAMRRDTRRMLVDYFRPYNERLSELLGRGFDWDR